MIGIPKTQDKPEKIMAVFRRSFQTPSFTAAALDLSTPLVENIASLEFATAMPLQKTRSIYL